MAQSRNDWLSSLYRASYRRLYRVAFHLTGREETAGELVQDVFLLALLHRQELLSHPRPEAWLMRVLTNLCKNETRRRFNRDLSLDALPPQIAPQEPPGVAELLPRDLPQADQTLLIWRFEQRLDYREIAARLGLSQSACRSRVFRALARCRKLLTDEKFSETERNKTPSL